jgi:hypothetical protein
MKQMFSCGTIPAAIMIVVIVVASACLIPRGPEGTKAIVITTSAASETGPLVLAQFNPCPNGRCR